MTAKDTRALPVGTPVFCTVRGTFYGWHRVTAVRPRDGYLKISGYGPWCPPHNFTLHAFSTEQLADAPNADDYGREPMADILGY